MALRKSYTTSSGAVGDYHVITSFRWEPDGETPEASAIISLYLDKSSSDAGRTPLVPIIGKFRLFGPAFEAHLSRSALKAADVDIVAQLYIALKAACVTAHASEQRDRKQFLSSDCGFDFYRDALDV